MTMVNELDLGNLGLMVGPDAGQIARSAVLEDGRELHWGGGGRGRTRQVIIPVIAQGFNGIGGQPAGSLEAARYLVVQLQELARNPKYNPVYIQWRSGAGTTIADPFDGWWRLDAVEPLEFFWTRHIPVRLSATAVDLATGTARQAMRYDGGSLLSNYSGLGIPLVSYPINATGLVGPTGTRPGAEGSIPYTLNPNGGVQRLPYQPSGVVSDWWKGRVRVYDTLVSGGNAVPVNGSFVNTTWVQVYETEHAFRGDCVITNGLHLYVLQPGTTRVLRGYLWSTGIAAPAAWQQFADVLYFDNAGNQGTLRGVDLDRVGPFQSSIVVECSTSAGQVAEITISLRPGHLAGRLDYKPLTQAGAGTGNLSLLPAGAAGMTYDSAKLLDPRLAAEQSPAANVATDYGYAAFFTPATASPFIFGWLFQNQPASQLSPGATNLSVVEANGVPAIGFRRTYGIFAVPFGSSGIYSPVNLQAEAETSPTAPFVSAADATASGGNALKLPSGTVLNTAISVIGAAWAAPPAGTFAIFMRMRVTAQNSAANQFTYWENDGGADHFITGVSPNGLATAYLWYLLGVRGLGSNPVTKVQGVGTGSTTTDWWVDEVAFVPLTLTAASTGPQDVFQQWLLDYELQAA